MHVSHSDTRTLQRPLPWLTTASLPVSISRTLVLPKLYSNSLLVSLNNRVFMRRGKDSDTAMVDSYLLTTLSPATGSVQKKKSGGPPRHVSNTRDGGGLEAHVHEVTFSDYDEVHLGKSLPSNGDSLQNALV